MLKQLAALAAGTALCCSGTLSTAIEDQIMMSGTWEGDYIDIDGHRGRVTMEIEHHPAEITGTLKLTLATEDNAEYYNATVTGSSSNDTAILQVHWPSQEATTATLTLARPAAFAEQTAFGILQASPSIKLGGGVLILWRFRQD